MSDYKNRLLLAATKRTGRLIECPEIEAEIYVRVLTAKEQGDYEKQQLEIVAHANDPTKNPDLARKARVRMASLFLAHPDGSRFTDKPEELEGFDWRILERVIMEGIALNDSSQPDFDALKKKLLTAHDNEPSGD